MFKIKCIDNEKCENFLELNGVYSAKKSEIRKDCYTVKVRDKKNRIVGEKWFDFRKHRFEIV